MLSNTAVPRYYGAFRDAVIRGDIPVCKEVAMEMYRIDRLIESPSYYYDDRAVEGWIDFCENELTLTDGSDLHLLDTFKLWGEQVFGWYYFDDRSVYVPNPDGRGGRYVTKRIKQRLTKKQYLIVGRGAAKSLYDSCIQAYFCIVDGSTTHQITTAPTMKQAEEIVNPIKTAITRARGPVFQFMTEGSLQNTTGSRANRVKLASTKKGIENFISGSLIEVRPMSVDKLQGLRCKVATVDEWLSSADAREDVIGAIEQGASMGADLSQGDDFCSFTFLFPLRDGAFGVKTRNYITSVTLHKLPAAMRVKYEDFMAEGSLIVMEGTVLDMMQVYEDLDDHIINCGYDVRCFGYDPYNAKEFVERWVNENGPFGVEVVRQGARTESVPLGELKKLAGERMLLFDEDLITFSMGNCITMEDTNGNRKLLKKRSDQKIDAVAAMMDAYVAYKHNPEAFE